MENIETNKIAEQLLFFFFRRRRGRAASVKKGLVRNHDVSIFLPSVIIYVKNKYMEFLYIFLFLKDVYLF